MSPSFSIITACKGRLDHLRRSLPQMLGQPSAEVIVVDYSCPEGTADVVEREFPQAKVVRVEGEKGFSNWRARNLGAAAASGNVLIFCDADTILADNAVERIASALPPKTYGFFKRDATERFNKAGLRLGSNQLRGFHAIPAAAYRRLGGYDEVLLGWGAGGDTDLEIRLILAGLSAHPLDPGLVEDVIQHDNADRTRHHADSIKVSYCTGLLYRRAKMALLNLRHRLNLPLELRQQLYDKARTAAQNLGTRDTVALSIDLENKAIGMPLQLGYRRVTQKVVMRIEVSGVGKIDTIPELVGAQPE
ncbi:glycosyltransferase family 2 protein [Sphingomonas sp. URHD0057]|uniref:glycosyltransferase family 2 protein n=1 Tax=Sphingomonas sp. URHD0057 TaxID=1380389 RepID=UPI00048ED451|nr:glycosyltransferase [Sphingomonas sp. URHD0057]